MKRWSILAVALTALTGVSCQKPVDTEPVADSSAFEIPVPGQPPTERRVVAAVAEATAAVAADSESAAVWGRLGAVFDAHSYFPEAAVCYRRARSLDPDDFRWVYHLAITLDREAGDPREVIDLFTRAATSEPRYPPVHYRLGTTFYRHGRNAEARQAFERALELDPDLAVARRHLGLALLADGATEAALAELERAIVDLPNDASTHSALAQTLARLGRTDEARAAATAASKLSPELGLPDPVRREVNSLGVSAFLAYKRGQSALAAGRVDEAIELFHIKDEVSPSASNHYFLGLAHRQAGRLDKAASHFERAIALADHADSHWQLGELMLTTGRHADGLDQLRQARATGSGIADLLHGVGASLARYGQLEDAIGAFAEASYLDTTNATLETDWCGALLQLGRLEESLVHCERAVELDGSSARAHFHLGLVLDSSGRSTAARRHYEQAVELDPSSRARRVLDRPRPEGSQ